LKGLDTNVLIRYIVEDDPAQTKQAAKIIEDAARQQESLFVSLPVLCEVVWVLDRSYRQPRVVIADALEAILDADVFRVQMENCARESLHRFRAGKAGFADFVIGAIAQEAGCDWVYTFDGGLKGAAGFRVLI
jgi:predicted nucleic-acid-binding protein